MECLDLFSIGVSEKGNHNDPQETSMILTRKLYVDYGVSTVWQSRPFIPTIVLIHVVAGMAAFAPARMSLVGEVDRRPPLFVHIAVPFLCDHAGGVPRRRPILRRLLADHG